jgi:hypothetical protein
MCAPREQPERAASCDVGRPTPESLACAMPQLQNNVLRLSYVRDPHRKHSHPGRCGRAGLCSGLQSASARLV